MPQQDGRADCLVWDRLCTMTTDPGTHLSLPGGPMPARDPRRDPQPGDILEKHAERRVVLRVANDTVFYDGPEAVGFRFQSCWLTDWRAWAAEAAVVSPEP